MKGYSRQLPNVLYSRIEPKTIWLQRKRLNNTAIAAPIMDKRVIRNIYLKCTAICKNTGKCVCVKTREITLGFITLKRVFLMEE